MILILLTSVLLAAPAPGGKPPPKAKTKVKKAEPTPAPAPAPAPEKVEAPAPAPQPAPAPAATVTAPTPAPAAALPAGKPPLKLGAPGLQQVGLTKELAAFYGDHFAQQLTLAGVVVSTSTEIQAVLGLERQRQLIGCEDKDCVGDLGALLGVEALLTGAIAKVGNTYQLNIKVIDGKTGAGLSAASLTTTSESELLESMGRAARAMARELFEKLDRAPTGLSAQRDVNAGWVRRRSWIPAVAGVVLLGGGVPLMISGSRDYNDLNDSFGPADLKGQTPEAFAATGQLKQVLGLTLTSVGGAALLAAGAMFLFGGEQDTPVALIAPLSSGGAAVVFTGALP